MNLLRKTWINFKAQPDIWFFYGFLLTFTLSIRKILYSLPLNSKFNEYSTAYLYLSDIFLFLAITSWMFIILRNNNHDLSIRAFISRLSINKMFHVEHFSYSPILPIAILVTWSITSLIWAHNSNVAVFRLLKLIEFTLLILFLRLNMKCSTWNNIKNILKILILAGVLNSAIGIFQFIIQGSLGLTWLRESIIDRNAPYIAKIILHSEPFIRAYGLFPHPNILGGYLVLSILSTFGYARLFHVEQSSSFKLLYRLIIAIQAIALLLTFSKTALIGLIVASFYILIKLNVPRGTLLNRLRVKMFRVEHLFKTSARRKAILSGLILLVFFLLIGPNIKSFLITPAQDRILFAEIYTSMITTHPFIGFGIGQSVIEMTNFLHIHTIDWQLQPVHNVFMLIWTELGIIGLMVFLLLLNRLFHVEQKIEPAMNIECSTWNKSHCEVYDPIRNVPRGTVADTLNLSILFKGILLGFIFIMLFDHYFWDIQQGELMLWLVMGVIASF